MRLPVTIWMNMPTFYQADLFRALAAIDEVDLQVIFAEDLPASRRQLGWRSDLNGYDWYLLNERFRVMDAVRLAWLQRSSRLHVVNGVWAQPPFAAALSVFASTGSRYAIYSEASNPNYERSSLKKTMRYAFARPILSRAEGVLAVSRLGSNFYQGFNVPEEKLYPFGYFRSRPGFPVEFSKCEEAESFTLMFVGQLIRRKGVDLLLRAMASLVPEYNLLLHVLGQGGQLEELEGLCLSLGLDDRVHFAGSVSSDQVLNRMYEADLLVLPSRWDGWGIVVNEALSVGLPVIVSDQCGASDLVKEGSNGYVFSAGDVIDLRRKIELFATNRHNWLRMSNAAIRTAERISVDAVAPYLINCLEHMIGVRDRRPYPPWIIH